MTPFAFLNYILIVVSTCSVYSLPFGGDVECSANISLEGKSC